MRAGEFPTTVGGKARRGEGGEFLWVCDEDGFLVFQEVGLSGRAHAAEIIKGEGEEGDILEVQLLDDGRATDVGLSAEFVWGAVVFFCFVIEVERQVVGRGGVKREWCEGGFREGLYHGTVDGGDGWFVGEVKGHGVGCGVEGNIAGAQGGERGE